MPKALKNLALSACAVSSILVPGLLRADVILPAATGSFTVISNGTVLESGSGLSMYDTPSTYSGGATLSVLNFYGPIDGVAGDVSNVSSQINFSGSTNNHLFEVLTSVTYDFAVNGPAGETVPVDILSSGTAAVSAGNAPGLFADGVFTVSEPGTGVLYSTSACAGAVTGVSACPAPTSFPPPASGNFEVDPRLLIQTDTIYQVTISSDVTIEPTVASGAFFGRAAVDPTIRLDSTDPSLSLAFSPTSSATTSAATPEPGTLALTASGLLAVFGRLRRRVG